MLKAKAKNVSILRANMQKLPCIEVLAW